MQVWTMLNATKQQSNKATSCFSPAFAENRSLSCWKLGLIDSWNLRGWTFFRTFTLWKFTARALAAPRHRKGPSLHRFASVLAPVNKFTPQVGCIPAKSFALGLHNTCTNVRDLARLGSMHHESAFRAPRTRVRFPGNLSRISTQIAPLIPPVMGEERPPLIPRKGEEEEIKINRQIVKLNY